MYSEIGVKYLFDTFTNDMNIQIKTGRARLAIFFTTAVVALRLFLHVVLTEVERRAIPSPPSHPTF